MSLKRHPALQPFSRDHVVGLFHAHQLIWLSEGRARFDAATTIENFRHAWDAEIAVHFAEEEEFLSVLALKNESIERLLRDHSEIRAAVTLVFSGQTTSLEDLHAVGSRLEAHIRWEEHELFPEIEQTLSEEALAELQKISAKIDLSRSRSI